MRRHAIVIRLGAREWSVRPLTVMQVQAIEPVLADASRGEVSNLGAAVSILRIALMRDHPEDASTLDEVEAAAREISAAMADILRLGGFLPEEGAAVPLDAMGHERSTGIGSTHD